jgi:hypothetical protein
MVTVESVTTDNMLMVGMTKLSSAAFAVTHEPPTIDSSKTRLAAKYKIDFPLFFFIGTSWLDEIVFSFPRMFKPFKGLYKKIGHTFVHFII